MRISTKLDRHRFVFASLPSTSKTRESGCSVVILLFFRPCSCTWAPCVSPFWLELARPSGVWCVGQFQNSSLGVSKHVPQTYFDPPPSLHFDIACQVPPAVCHPPFLTFGVKSVLPWMDKFKGTGSDRHVPLLNCRGQPAIRKDQCSNRGDVEWRMGLNATQALTLSVSSLGSEEGFPPHRSRLREFTAAHRATTIESLHLAYESDTKSENRMVQLSVAPDLPHAQTQHERIPRDGAIFWKEYGNVGNDQITQQSIRESYREAPDIDK